MKYRQGIGEMARDRRIGAVILAAGASTRLGRPKQTVVLAGETLLDRTVRIASQAGLSEIIVVLGAFADEIRASCKLQGCRVVLNSGWESGLAASIRAGVAELRSVEGVIVMTCDMPSVTAAHLAALAASEKVTASRYAGSPGVPAFFPATSFPELGQLRGSAGAKGLLASAETIDLPGGELDIDTPEDLDQMRSMNPDSY